MSSIEKKIISSIENNRNILFVGIITIISIFMRCCGIDYLSGDMSDFLFGWYNEIELLGSNSLSVQIGDYGILYQTLIFIMIKLPGSAIIKYKLLSILFDYLLAISVVKLITYMKNEKFFSTIGVLCYGIVLICPTVIFNSAYWGQCDSIYTTFCILTVLYLLKGKTKTSFAFYGLAIAFKLQAIFLLPFILCYYFYKKSFSILSLLISLAVFWFSGIPGYINGRSLLSVFLIYKNQANAYSENMTMNSPSIWRIFGRDCSQLSTFALLLTIAILGCGLMLILAKIIEIDSYEKIISFLCWTLWTCMLFLPKMHERYTFVLDIALITLALINIKKIYLLIISLTISCMTYGTYLFQMDVIDRPIIFIYITGWVLLFISLFNSHQKMNTHC